MIKTALLTALAVFYGALSHLDAQDGAGETPPTSEPSSFATKTIDEMTADEVLRLVRYSYTLYDRDFSGVLQMGFAKKDQVPFLLSLKAEAIRFIFDDPAQVIYIDTKDHRFSLFEGVGGSEMKPVAPTKYDDNLRGTDVTYDDLSMRFLYWPNAKVVEQDKYKGRDCIKVRARNPDGLGAYATVDVWIDKASGGMVKMMGYDNSGRAIRRFEVLHGKKFDDIWMVDDMRIETINSSSGQIDSSTRMRIQSTVD